MTEDSVQSLLQNETLRFSSAAEFVDEHEGAITVPMAEESRYFEGGPSPSFISEAFRRLKPMMKVSCWHLSHNESNLMWKVYAKQGKGVAIQTTVSRFMKSFKPFRLSPDYGVEDVHIGAVRYLDYARDTMKKHSMESPYFHKRKEFEGEKEVRALISLRMASEWGVDIPEKGIDVDVDLATLVERIVLPPDAPDDLHRRVMALADPKGLADRVQRSEMASTPNF